MKRPYLVLWEAPEGEPKPARFILAVGPLAAVTACKDLMTNGRMCGNFIVKTLESGLSFDNWSLRTHRYAVFCERTVRNVQRISP